jgi:tetratricopeptide (TPR) repeat protein
VLGPDSPDVLISMNNLANVLTDEKHGADAEKLQRQTLDLERRVLAPEHPYTLFSLANVGIDLSHEGRYSEGAKLFEQAIQIASKTNQPGIIDTLWYYFGMTAASAGHRDDAFQYPSNAVDHGFRDATAMQSEPELKVIRSDPRFQALLARMDQSGSKP